MPGPSSCDDTTAFSSRLTRRLVEEAKSLFGYCQEDPSSLDEQFSALSDHIQAALKEDARLSDDLIKLASLVNDQGESVPVDSAFRLHPSPDKMFITLTIIPAIGHGRPVTAKHIIDELRARNITRGVILNAIKSAVKDCEEGREVRDQVVVRGTPAIPGVAPWIAYFGRQSGGDLEEVDEALLLPGSDEPVLCEQGDTIAYVRQGDAGRAGFTATGQELPPPPPSNVLTLNAGRNVYFAGNCYIAEADGVVMIIDGCLSVQKALVLYRDAEVQDSPVDFDGSVFIHGGVKSGVVIKATEDIFIDRVVEGAQITSTGGSVVLRAGIAGRNKGRITAAHNVNCGFVENATVTAGNDILLHVGALNSQLTANHDILAETGKGGIAGGVLLAGHSVQAKRIGSYGTQTIVMAGINVDAIPELDQVNKQAATLQDRLQETNVLIAQFDRAVNDPRSLSACELQTYTYLHKLRLITSHELTQLNEHRHAILTNVAPDADGRIIIHQKLDHNVQFHMGPRSYSHAPAKGPLIFTYAPGRQHIICRSR